VIHTLFIPRWHPSPLNKLLGNRWQAHRLKKADRAMIWAYCLNNKVPMAEEKRRVTLTIILKPSQRACDPDAYQKSVGDALVHSMLLKNDNRQHVEWTPAQFERSTEWGTRITLEDQ
jgi:Holliday junction resolvase RusA-like endonuclease